MTTRHASCLVHIKTRTNNDPRNHVVGSFGSFVELNFLNPPVAAATPSTHRCLPWTEIRATVETGANTKRVRDQRTRPTPRAWAEPCDWRARNKSRGLRGASWWASLSTDCPRNAHWESWSVDGVVVQ